MIDADILRSTFLVFFASGAASVYETAPLDAIHERIASLSPTTVDERGSRPELVRSLRILTDHLRSAVFIFGDRNGVLPSNQGPGDVLRRLIRRAVRACQTLRIEPQSWARTAELVIDRYGSVYPELPEHADRISNGIIRECERFEGTLRRATAKLRREIARLRAEGGDRIPAEVAFHLYDTDGLPIEFTGEIAREAGSTWTSTASSGSSLSIGSAHDSNATDRLARPSRRSPVLAPTILRRPRHHNPPRGRQSADRQPVCDGGHLTNPGGRALTGDRLTVGQWGPLLPLSLTRRLLSSCSGAAKHGHAEDIEITVLGHQPPLSRRSRPAWSRRRSAATVVVPSSLASRQCSLAPPRRLDMAPPRYGRWLVLVTVGN